MDDQLMAGWQGPIAPLDPATAADRDAATRLCPTYALGIDQQDEALVRSVFAPDAVVEGMLGSAPIDEYIPQLLAGVRPYAATMHNITNQYCTMDGDTGTVWSYAVCLHLEEADNGRPDLHVGVQYRDQVRRDPGGWVIARRKTVAMWTKGPVPRPA